MFKCHRLDQLVLAREVSFLSKLLPLFHIWLFAKTAISFIAAHFDRSNGGSRDVLCLVWIVEYLAGFCNLLAAPSPTVRFELYIESKQIG